MRTATIKQLVRRAKLSKRDIRLRLRVSRATVSRWISGDRRPTLDHLLKLARLFKCPVERIKLGGNSRVKGR